ncbi:MAG: DUF4012 domain-containing protein [Acidimicrobiia bacterium]
MIVPARSDAAALRRRKRRRRLITLGILIVVLAWTAFAGYQLVQAKTEAQAGLDKLRSAQEGLDATELIRGKALPTMRRARTDFDRAASDADSSLLTPFEFLPYVGRQVRSVQALTRGASQVVHVGVTTMEQSTKQLAARTKSGPDRVALLRRLGTVGSDASAELKRVSLGPGEALVGPLAKARSKFARQLDKARRAVSDVSAAATGIAHMAQGPSKYLLLAANNGEMRAGSGMLLSVGVLTMDKGQFSLGEMKSVAEYELAPGAVPVTGDFGARWGWLEPTQDWRYLAMSPQFDVTGSLAAQMWKAKTGESVDGVLALDAVAMKALVKASGPVDVDGTRIDTENVVREILFEQYQDSAQDLGDPESDLPANQARRERNGVIARAIVDQLDRVGWDIADLVDDLRAAARGRHLLFWSGIPEQQRAWRAAGVAGILPHDGFMVSLENRGGNKLDQFLGVGATVSHRAVAAGSEVTAQITVTNLAPSVGVSRYVQGPYPFSDLVAGEYQGILAINMPAVARNATLDGVTKIVAAGADGSTRVVGGNMRVLRGETKQYTLRFTVPKGYERLQVIPSARYPAIRYHAGSETWDDDNPHPLHW